MHCHVPQPQGWVLFRSPDHVVQGVRGRQRRGFEIWHPPTDPACKGGLQPNDSVLEATIRCIFQNWDWPRDHLDNFRLLDSQRVAVLGAHPRGHDWLLFQSCHLPLFLSGESTRDIRATDPGNQCSHEARCVQVLHLVFIAWWIVPLLALPFAKRNRGGGQPGAPDSGRSGPSGGPQGGAGPYGFRGRGFARGSSPFGGAQTEQPKRGNQGDGPVIDAQWATVERQ